MSVQNGHNPMIYWHYQQSSNSWFSFCKIFLPEKNIMRKTVLHEKHNRWFLHPVHIVELNNENNIWLFKSMLKLYSSHLQTSISHDDPDNIMGNNP